jgi:hypothetical protein
MKRLASSTAVVLAALLTMGTAAHAQLFRAYVASYGVDTNPCTVASPCRLLPAALNAVADNGEIWILDSANFNTTTVNINKSVSILAVPGAVGSVVATGSAAAMQIATANVQVGLRNLVFTSVATAPGSNGIEVTNGTRLSIEDSVFANLPGRAISALGTPIRIHVRNSVFRHNAPGGTTYTVWAQDGPTVAIDNCQLIDNGQGVIAYGHTPGLAATVSVTDSVITGAGLGVVAASDAALAVAKAIVTRTTIAHGGVGLASQSLGGSAFLGVSNSTVSDNTRGYFQSGLGAIVKSLGNNYLDDNGGDSGTLTASSTR